MFTVSCSVCVHVCACTGNQVGGAGIAPPTELLGQLDSSTCAQLDTWHSVATSSDGDEADTMPCGDGDDDTEAKVDIGSEEQLPEICDDEVRKDDRDQQEAAGSMEVDRPSVHVLGR